MIFPYQKNSAGDFFPIIELFIDYKNKTTKTFSLIDSGATISVFKPQVAKSLDLKIEDGRLTYLGGVGGRIKGYIHILTLDIGRKLLKVPVVFSHEYTVSFNLLGRSGIFENFKITFDENNLKVKLT
ncbi:hypothetical protein A2774_03615 [Candidatus Roizmanbacteria bacterium RIFCSPHIGHO2_01_FULL_39_12c]|uniref:Peptidase A2 domain-containing protein n=1 Tax=Candidatus Roizmanbacteria bacterium RIFCSPHIGHO2_01_FULL_39_12c TaxID=1802031 RepID=A0A1F7GFG3_9BACT|nr:MAG: hypothetical protein A2774_03615 [Candidatus Roizmanbacteria bacterium RIFCSPHIGHO2_01_FULL_39_12c]OGK48151.1 MAG: hypothetical protein A2963_04360 [Candidatus Roizmanbacteria bacterium RIFCSPLOWO2_01_FULL_40_13]